MAIYHFDLKAGSHFVSDPIGTELADDAAAHAHALAVARELMLHREAKSRHWRLCVRVDGEEPRLHILFASVDQTLAAMDHDYRGVTERLSGTVANLSDAIGDLRLTLLQVKATLARVDARLHLAALDGVRL